MSVGPVRGQCNQATVTVVVVHSRFIVRPSKQFPRAHAKENSEMGLDPEDDPFNIRLEHPDNPSSAVKPTWESPRKESESTLFVMDKVSHPYI